MFTFLSPDQFLFLMCFLPFVQVDTELSKKLEWWDEKLRSESQKLCKEHLFTTGFLEGGGSHSLVDSYELKVCFTLMSSKCLNVLE